VTNDSGSDEEIKPDYITVSLPAVQDLRIIDAQTETGALTAHLCWTPLAQAVTTTLRCSPTLITEGAWAAATVISDSLPGSTDNFTAHIQYAGGTVYFALKSQDASGTWLGLSNNAYWPSFEVYLPLVMRY
jgi:PKD repeat protein